MYYGALLELYVKYSTNDFIQSLYRYIYGNKLILIALIHNLVMNNMESLDKIKVLFLSSEPKNITNLRLGEECREIQGQLNKSRLRESIELIPIFSARAGDIIESILQNSPNIVHFSGHGSSYGNLCIENESGCIHEITSDAVSSLFKLVKDSVQCVLLNACYSEIQAKEIAKHIDYVIGMKKEIGDVAAINFATGFYRAIGAGKSIEDAFDFGNVQLKIMNIKQDSVPILIKKSVEFNINPSESSPIFRQMLPGMKKYFYQYLIKDQIIDSGAWGKSEIDVMENATGTKYSENDRYEGGIISTYFALRALKRYEKTPISFRVQAYSRKALKYFLYRQTHKGGIGRMVLSRSGMEIHPSIRHTALSVAALIDLNAPSGAIFRGLDYINQHWSIEEILEDASPSIAIASIIHAMDKTLSNPQCLASLSEEEKQTLKIGDWDETRLNLYKELITISRSSDDEPFWNPYGKKDSLSYYTALITIDLLSSPLPKELGTVVCDILSLLMERLTSEGGIPFNQKSIVADFGISMYYYSLICRADILNNIENNVLLKNIEQSKSKIENYLISNWRRHEENEYTHCDTVASLFFIND